MSSRAPKNLSFGEIKDGPTHIISPKGISKKTPSIGESKATRTGLRGVRRRLSVISDNKLIEGFSELATEDGIVDDTVREKSANAIKVFSGLSKKGYAPYNPSKKNQDSMIMVEDTVTGAIFLSALDGHGEAGDFVSQYFRKRLPKIIFQHPKFLENPGLAMKDALAKVEKALLADSSIDTEFSGTTAVLGIIIGDTLTVANVGDSRVILGVQDPSTGTLFAEEISHDHKPDNPEEKRRIVATGGRVFAVEYDDGIDGPARVWLGHMDIPGLAMSRSLGDTVAHSAGVSSLPDIYTRKLTPNDKFLIMASDGLWEFMDNEMCVQMAAKYKSPKKAVEALVVEANALWMKMEQVVDDTTVIVAHFH